MAPQGHSGPPVPPSGQVALRPVAVIGSGTMGQGIAQLAAQAGHLTRLFDADASAAARGLDRAKAGLVSAAAKGKLSMEAAAAASARLSAATDLASALEGVGAAIEAVPEQLALKIAVFLVLARLAPTDALLASNTSSLSLTEIAAGSGVASRVVGMHFFNPPPAMKLLELVRAEQTSAETLVVARELGQRMGKTVIEVRDSPGFASSRLGIALALEAIRMLEERVATAADIDTAMKLGYGHPMGPLELTDLVGLDVRLAIAEHLARQLPGQRFQPPALLESLVREGKLGRKSGEGFYRYPPVD